MDEKVENKKARVYESIQKREKSLERLFLNLQQVDEDSLDYVRISQWIIDNQAALQELYGIVEFLRPNDENDIELRKAIGQHFPQAIKETFPDGFPIVFHGTKYLATVREILRTGGLLTPEQRGISIRSTAPAIDVTYKNNIKTSCDFADASVNTYLPYGAIFAFMPQEDEIENVINTGAASSAVSSGVNGVSFRDEPHRLFGIITTPENIERVQDWCVEYGIDPCKVYTHAMFLENYKTKFNELKTNSTFSALEADKQN